MPGTQVNKQKACQNSCDDCETVPESDLSLKTDLRSVQNGGEPEIHERVDLRAWTVLGVGGLADILIRCRSADGLQRALDLLAAHGERWMILGAGTRLVPSDRGMRVPILNLAGNLALWELEVDGAVAGGGAILAQVCRAAARTGLSGMEPLMVSAGSVGGAICAARHGQVPLRGILDWVDLARPGAGFERVHLGGGANEQRRLDLDMQRRVLVQARLKMSPEVGSVIHSRIEDGDHRQFQRQPRSAYPFFVGPEGVRAEAVLVETGCLGMMVGGARLSERTPNRINTSRAARSSDVLELARAVREKALVRSGVELTPGMFFVDEDGREIEL